MSTFEESFSRLLTLMGQDVNALKQETSRWEKEMEKGANAIAETRDEFGKYFTCMEGSDGKISQALFVKFLSQRLPQDKALNIAEFLSSDLNNRDLVLMMLCKNHIFRKGEPQEWMEAYTTLMKRKTFTVHGLLEYEFLPSIVNEHHVDFKSNLTGQLVITQPRTPLRSLKLLGECIASAKDEVGIFLDVKDQSCMVTEEATTLTNNLDSFVPVVSSPPDELQIQYYLEELKIKLSHEEYLMVRHIQHQWDEDEGIELIQNPPKYYAALESSDNANVQALGAALKAQTPEQKGQKNQKIQDIKKRMMSPPDHALECKTTISKDAWNLPSCQWQIISFHHVKAVCKLRWQPAAQSQTVVSPKISSQTARGEYVVQDLGRGKEVGILSFKDVDTLPNFKTLKSQLDEFYAGGLPADWAHDWQKYLSADGAAQWKAHRSQRHGKYG